MAAKKVSAGSPAPQTAPAAPAARHATVTAPAPVASRPPQLGSDRVTESKARPSHEEIARVAYLRWLEHGGDEVVNWLEAERELTRIT